MAGCGGEAIGPLQRRIDAREEMRSSLAMEGLSAQQLAEKAPAASPEELAAAKQQNDGCTSANRWKNVLTGVGGILTAAGGGVTIGAAYATAAGDSNTKLDLGVTGGALTGLGGTLVVVGALVQQHYADTSCTPK
jgi:hypothetical protein